MKTKWQNLSKLVLFAALIPVVVLVVDFVFGIGVVTALTLLSLAVIAAIFSLKE